MSAMCGFGSALPGAQGVLATDLTTPQSVARGGQHWKLVEKEVGKKTSARRASTTIRRDARRAGLIEGGAESENSAPRITLRP